jgi:serine/threonine-protein kinase
MSAEAPPLRRQWKGVRIGAHEVVRLLGHGATSTVFEARHVALGRPVAIKLLHEHLSGDQKLVQRFLREGKIASQIRHPNVVDVLDVGEHEGLPYLVMELLDGADLASWLRAHGRLSVPEALATFLPLASALAAAHAMGTLHRDLKPGNVVLAHDARGDRLPKLVDFGLSKRMGGDSALPLTQGDAVLGTLGYMAPEQLLATAEADERSDQYGLGAILYECLTASPPYQGATVAELLEAVRKGPVPPVRTIVPEVPAALDEIVMRALARDREARFEDVRAFAAALLPFAEPSVSTFWARDFISRPQSEPRRPSDSTVVASTPTVVERTPTAVPASSPRANATAVRVMSSPRLQAMSTTLPVPAGTSKFRIKGTLYRGFQQGVEKRVAGGIEAFCAAIQDEQLRAFARQSFLASSFYDVLPMFPLMLRLAEAISMPFERVVIEAGAAQARLDASGVYKTMMTQTSTAEELPSKVARWAQRHYDYGESVLAESKPGRLVLRRIGQPTFVLPWLMGSQAAYLEQIARMMGFTRAATCAFPPSSAGRSGPIALSEFDTELTY